MNKDFVLITLATAMFLSILGMLPLRALGFSALCWIAIILFCNSGSSFLVEPQDTRPCLKCGAFATISTILAIVVLAL